MKYQVTISNGRAVNVREYNGFLIATSVDGEPLTVPEQNEAKQLVRDKHAVAA